MAQNSRSGVGPADDINHRICRQVLDCFSSNTGRP